MVVAHRECDLRIDVGCDQLRGPAIVTDRDETGGAVVRQQARITVSLQPFFSASRALCGMCAGPNRSLKKSNRVGVAGIFGRLGSCHMGCSRPGGVLAQWQITRIALA